jgi:hypothetical protein
VFSIRKSPFAGHEDPLTHMLALLSEEAEKSGITFTADEKTILRSERTRGESIPEGLREKSKKLIEQLLIKERSKDSDEDPKGFSNSLQWAGDGAYPNVVALAEEVIMSGGFGAVPLQGKRLVKDRMSLVGCALLVVLFMALVIAAVSVLFH